MQDFGLHSECHEKEKNDFSSGDKATPPGPCVPNTKNTPISSNMKLMLESEGVGSRIWLTRESHGTGILGTVPGT